MFRGVEEVLSRGGIDYADAMERFDGNESLYLRLLAKYPGDPHCERLAQALEEGDAEAARRETHAIKGVAGNLSLVALYRAVSDLFTVLQTNGNIAARVLYSDVQKAHKDVMAALEELHREDAE